MAWLMLTLSGTQFARSALPNLVRRAGLPSNSFQAPTALANPASFEAELSRRLTTSTGRESTYIEKRSAKLLGHRQSEKERCKIASSRKSGT